MQERRYSLQPVASHWYDLITTVQYYYKPGDQFEQKILYKTLQVLVVNMINGHATQQT